MLDMRDPELAFAVETVRQASRLAASVQRELAAPALEKRDRSPVTVADYAVQALVGCMLEQAFPHMTLVAEEDASALRDAAHAETCAAVARYVGRVLAYATPQTVCAWIDTGGGDPEERYWTLDPVDGTKGFLRGEQYAVAFALVEGGTVRLGVLGCPNLTDACRADPGGPGTLVAAARGQGAWHCPLAKEGPWQPLRVSSRANPADARLLRSAESGHTNVGRMGRLVEHLGVAAEPVLMDSQAKYAVLAAGEGDVLFRLLSSRQPDYAERIWDQAAGSLVVEEAGGRITDLHGAALDFTAGRTLARNRGVVASNGLLHEAALAALRAME